jgi:hypothetical protein
MEMDELVQEVDRTIRVYEELIGHAAMRTRNMIDVYGHVEALSRLVVSADLQQGFQVLNEKGRSKDSFEALVIRFSGSFRDDVVAAAQWRLDNPDDLLKRVR